MAQSKPVLDFERVEIDLITDSVFPNGGRTNQKQKRETKRRGIGRTIDPLHIIALFSTRIPNLQLNNLI